MDSAQKSAKNNELPILIYDRQGTIGAALVETLADEYPCVFASSSFSETAHNIVRVHLTKRIPKIPRCIYKAFFLFYNNDRSMLDLLPAFVQKAKDDNAHIYFIISRAVISESIIENVKKLSAAVTVVIIGDLYGKNIGLKNQVTDLLEQANSGSIVLRDSGLSLIYPVDIDSLLTVFRKLVKLKGIQGHPVIYLLPPHPVSELSFVHVLQKKEPLLKVDFRSISDVKKKEYLLPNYVSAFGNTFSYSKKLPGIEIKSKKQAHKTDSPQKKKIFSALRHSTGITDYVTNLFRLCIVAVLFAFFGTPILTAFMGAGFLYRTQEHLQNRELGKAHTTATASYTFFKLSERSAIGLYALNKFGINNQVYSIVSGIQTGKQVSEIIVSGIDALTLLQKVYQGNSLEPKRDFQLGLQNGRNALVQFSALQAEGKIPAQYERHVRSIERIQHLANALADVLPFLAGMEKEQKYLVLFQNNMELRPGGGFIGSYGILRMNKGRIVDFPIHDVYDADGQLKEHYEPPFQLRRYMGSSHWFLRDSNFDIDFTKNGASAAFFYNAETSDDVGGVIAVDTDVLRSLLTIFGPLKVIGYPETVTADNFFMLTEQYAQDNFFPGSRQKQDFLKAVASSLFAKLTDSEDIPYLAIAQTIADNIAQKHILFAFPDENIQQVFTINGMSGSFADSRIDIDSRANDFLGLSEANLGMNKVNYYLDRSLTQTIELGTNGLSTGSASLQYVNRSKANSKYGGDYKNYLRIILPSNARLQEVQFNGVTQQTTPAIIDPVVFTASGFTPLSGLEVEQKEEYGKTVYGFLVVVPQGEKKTVRITYTIPTKITAGDSEIIYSLKVLKQPGTGADPYSLSVTAPDTHSILKTSVAMKSTGHTANLLTTLAEDREVEIRMGKK